jgi:chemotaxis protein CheD
MTSTTVFDAIVDTNVGMGQIVAVQGAARLGAVLGSCVAVAMHSPQHGAGALGHVVLPNSAGRATSDGKFADTAIPAMLAALAKMGVPSSSLIVKIAGGASMFGASGALQIGIANIEAVTKALRNARINLAAQDVGGQKGRRVSLDPATGEFTVEIVGAASKTL